MPEGVVDTDELGSMLLDDDMLEVTLKLLMFGVGELDIELEFTLLITFMLEAVLDRELSLDLVP